MIYFLDNLQSSIQRLPSKQNFSSAKITLGCTMLSHFSCAQFFTTLWAVAHQATLSTGFPRQEYWSGLPHPLQGDLPDPGIKPESLTFPALAGGFFTTSATWEVLKSPELLPSKTTVYGICTLTHAPGYFLFLVMWQFDSYNY